MTVVCRPCPRARGAVVGGRPPRGVLGGGAGVQVDAEIGPMKVTFAVVTRKRRRLAVLAPEAADRTEGIRLPPVLQEVVHEAVMTAAKADPAAHQVLMRREDAGA